MRFTYLNFGFASSSVNERKSSRKYEWVSADHTLIMRPHKITNSASSPRKLWHWSLFTPFVLILIIKVMMCDSCQGEHPRTTEPQNEIPIHLPSPSSASPSPSETKITCLREGLWEHISNDWALRHSKQSFSEWWWPHDRRVSEKTGKTEREHRGSQALICEVLLHVPHCMNALGTSETLSRDASTDSKWFLSQEGLGSVTFEWPK